MNCREHVELLMDYFEGRLSSRDRAAVDAHFAACPPCLEFARSYRATPRILRAATARRMPAEVSARLEAVLRAKGAVE